MASLTLAKSNEILAITDEKSLTDDQFSLIRQIAEAPPPALRPANDGDVRAVIGSLAGILKQSRTNHDEGKLKLGLYRKALVGVPAPALAYAGDLALKELEWMPVPSEILALTKRYLAPEIRLQDRAKFLARNRKQRLFEERCESIKARTLPADQLDNLTAQEIRVGVDAGTLLRCHDGAVVYWSKEAMEADLIERECDEGRCDERNNRAHASPPNAKPQSSKVGDLAGNVMDGLEVDDE